MPSSSNIPSKLLAVDPSLTCSGWVLFSLQSLKPLFAGTISPPGPKCLPLCERFEFLQNEVFNLLSNFSLSSKDYLVTEGPAPLVQNPSSSTKVEQVRSTFEVLARNQGVTVPGRVNPRTIQTQLLGLKGAQIERSKVKAIAKSTANQLYGKELEQICKQSGFSISQDIIDASLIGGYAGSLIKNAIVSNIPAWKFFLPKHSSNNRSGSLRWSASDLKKARA